MLIVVSSAATPPSQYEYVLLWNRKKERSKTKRSDEDERDREQQQQQPKWLPAICCFVSMLMCY